jgi:protein O-GlcNAc transferase
VLGRLINQLVGRLVRRTEKVAIKEKGAVNHAQMRLALDAQQRGDYAAVEAICRSRLTDLPGDTDALHLLATALCAQGRTSEGIVCLHRIVALKPDALDAHLTLATVFAALGDIEASITAYRDVLQIRPTMRTARHKLVALLRSLSRYDEAEECCLAGLAVDAGDATLRRLLGKVRFEQGRVDEAIIDVRAALVLNPDASDVHSDLINMLNYTEAIAPAEIFAECRRWAARFATPLETQVARLTRDATAERKLRVGYVSPGFREHPVAFFLRPVIEHHDRRHFEISLYSDVSYEDEYTEVFRARVDSWRSVVGVDDSALADIIRADAIDILVDLSGHTAHNRLLAFARRPAAVQVNWLGFPCTTGMHSMDYRITDSWCDPPGQTEGLNSETLVRLPQIYMAWNPPLRSPNVSPLPALTSGHVTFGFFHGCFKISPRMIALWARILHRVPGSRLVVLAVDGEVAVRRLRQAFAVHGISADRLELLPRLSIDDFMAAHARVDIALGPFPYHGATTTCFSLWMGLPVIVLTGTTHASRADLSMLANVGLRDHATDDPSQYVSIACRLASSIDELAQLRARLRSMMFGSPVMDGPGLARELETAYRSMWYQRRRQERDY